MIFQEGNSLFRFYLVKIILFCYLNTLPEGNMIFYLFCL